jgi:hypothetical protein
MAKITILESDPKTGELKLSDCGKSRVNKDRAVIWKLGKDCGVSDITAITSKDSPSSTDIFAIQPHRDRRSTNWRAHVHIDASTNAEYHYNIHWKDLKGDTPPPYDPILKVNP